MPWNIEKHDGCFKVVNKKTGKVHAKCTTKEKAEAQIRLLRGVEHGMKTKNESLTEALNTKMKVSIKKAMEMMKKMYPKHKTEWEGSEILNFKKDGELVGSWENGTLQYKFKNTNESNIEKLLTILESNL